MEKYNIIPERAPLTAKPSHRLRMRSRTGSEQTNLTLACRKPSVSRIGPSQRPGIESLISGEKFEQNLDHPSGAVSDNRHFAIATNTSRLVARYFGQPQMQLRISN